MIPTGEGKIQKAIRAFPNWSKRHIVETNQERDDERFELTDVGAGDRGGGSGWLVRWSMAAMG